MNAQALSAYQAFKTKLNSKIIELEKKHQQHLSCKNGCDLCCYSFRVFPVEFYAIAQSLNIQPTLQLETPISDNERCSFLKNQSCSIYDARPIICRTHGLPLLNMNEEGTEWELNICELNFNDADDEIFEDDENVLLQDKINSELFQINQQFIKDNPSLGLTDFDLIPLKNL